MTPSLKFALLAVILCVGVHSEDLTLPTTVKTCKRDSDDYESCLRLAIQESWPTMVKGLPEFDLPALDPYVIDYLDTVYDGGEVKGRVQVKDSKTYGMSKARFLSVRPRHEAGRFSLEVDLEFPKLLIEGYYKAEGSLGAFKMGGKGFFNVSTEGVRAHWYIQGPVKNDRWIVEKFTTDPEINKMQVYFSDLFNGNQVLNRAAMDFINEYWPLLYKSMLPYAEKTWSEKLSEVANRFFSKVSFAAVFP